MVSRYLNLELNNNGYLQHHNLHMSIFIWSKKLVHTLQICILSTQKGILLNHADSKTLYQF